MKYTPGPWQINNRVFGQVCDCDGEKRGCAPIAVMRGTNAERRANAHLIAAAPDLLEALKTSLSIMNIQRDIVERGQHSSAWEHPISMCEAAIAKAEQK